MIRKASSLKIARTSEDYRSMLRDQYHLLARAVADFYLGDLVQSLNISRSLRTFIHRTDRNFPLLKNFDGEYWEKTIFDQDGPPAGNVVMHVPMCFEIDPNGIVRPCKPPLGEGVSKLMPLKHWWYEPYLVVPEAQFSKRELILDLAEKDGGVHVDPTLNQKYAAIKANPPLAAGLFRNEDGTGPVVGFGHYSASPSGPDPIDTIRYIVGASGFEFLDYLRRNYGTLL